MEPQLELTMASSDSQPVVLYGIVALYCAYYSASLDGGTSSSKSFRDNKLGERKEGEIWRVWNVKLEGEEEEEGRISLSPCLLN